jgi:uncharacterized Zn finger protein
MPRKQTTAPTTDDRFAPLSDDDIRRHTDEGSFTRGRSYFRNGHIREPIRRDDTIEAKCVGSEPVPYRVSATLARAGSGTSPKTASCTCPRGGFCKHIVALLLTWIDDPSRFTELPPMADQLADRSPEQLIALIERMVDRYPDLQRLIDLPMPPSPTSSGDVAANAVTVDVEPIRQQVRLAIQEFDPYARFDRWDDWADGSGTPAELAAILDLAQRYADAGQWANAQAIATALIEETVDVLPTLNDQDGDISVVVIDADEVLARALDAQANLPEDQRLSPAQREALFRTTYAIWRADIFTFGGIDLSQHGIEAVITHAMPEERQMVEGWLRVEQADGWSKRAVVGFIADLREADDDLDREALLALYRENDLWDDVAGLLLELGKVEEAIATARQHLRVPHELTQFADALMRKDEEHATRAIGLVDDLLWEIEGRNTREDQQLQVWLEQQYARSGREGDALKLARRRFDQAPSVRTYNDVEQIARLPGQPDGTWDDVRPELLLTLKSKNDWVAVIHIHVAANEGMAALEALDTLNKKQKASAQLSPSWGGGLVAGGLSVKVAAAVERDAPDRAIELNRRAADQAIAMKNRQSYQSAAEHLALVKAILDREGRRNEWKT